MEDILDSIDEIDFDESEESESTEVVEVDESMISDINDVTENGAMMTQEAAQELTTAIKSTSVALYILISEAHKGKAYRALGYETWKEYIETEFDDLSLRQSYRLLDLARVTEALEGAVPEGTKLKLTSAQAIAIKKELPKITDEVKEATEGKTPEEASDFIDEMIARKREDAKEAQKVVDAKEKALEEAREEGRRAGLEAAADSFLEENGGNSESNEEGQPNNFAPDSPDYMTSSADGEFVEIDVQGEGSVSPQMRYALSNIANLAVSVDSLPDPEALAQAVPVQGIDQYFDQVQELQEYINRFATLLEERKYALDND